MSLAVEEKAAKSQEDKELEEAIRLSQMEYEKSAPKKEEPPSPKKAPLGPLPPLVLATKRENRPVKEFKEEESKLKEEISELKKKEEERQAKAKEEQEGA